MEEGRRGGDWEDEARDGDDGAVDGDEVIEEGDARIVRTGPGACVHEDRAAGVAIEARVPSDAEWRAAFERDGRWTVTCEPLGVAETRIVARSRSEHGSA